MILPNIHKFEYGPDYIANMRKLSTEIVSDNVILCPQKNSLYTWWLPKTSPNHENGGWAKLKHMSTYENKNVSLWDRKQTTSGGNYYHDDIKDIVQEKMDIYFVKMKDVGYTFQVKDGQNFTIYIMHDEIMYSTNLTNDQSNELMVSSSKSIMYPIYNLETNSIMYSMNEWAHLDNLAEWTLDDENLLNEELKTPETSCRKNLMEEYGSNSESKEESEEESEEESGGPNLIYDDTEKEDDENDEEYEDDEDDEDYEDDEDDEDDEDYEDDEGLIPFYNPWSMLTNEEKDAAYALGFKEDTWESENPFQVNKTILEDWSDYSDKAREHLMTLGMDEECWNEYVEENCFENNDITIAEGIPVDDYKSDCDSDEVEDIEYRMDYSDGNWYTKKEFKEYYGSHYVWKMMAPKKYIMREVLYYTYFTAANLPRSLQKAFIEDYTTTYY